MNVVMVIYFGMLMISNDCWDASNEMKWKKKKNNEIYHYQKN
jgi:hypothetical protein